MHACVLHWAKRWRRRVHSKWYTAGSSTVEDGKLLSRVHFVLRATCFACCSLKLSRGGEGRACACVRRVWTFDGRPRGCGRLRVARMERLRVPVLWDVGMFY